MKNGFQLMLLLGAAMLGSCGGSNEKKVEKVEDERPLVKIAGVSERRVAQIQEYTATVEAEVKNNIAPFTPVRISDIKVEIGDRVKKGQELVIMDRAKLKQLELQLKNVITEFNRVDELYKVGGVSKSDWDAIKTEHDVRTTAFKEMMENITLSSPIDGVVTARNYDDGDMYSGGLPILTVEQIAPVKLLINVSETHYTQVKKGAPVSIKLDVYGNEEFRGKVSLVYPTINAETRTFQVEVRMDNRDYRVRPGMFARVTMNFGEKMNVVVPDMAIVKQPGSGDRYVYVYENGKVNYNKVELGRRLGTEYELISGVPDKAQVVIAGQTRLLDGIEVRVEE